VLITTRKWDDLAEAKMICLEDLKEVEALALIRNEGQRLGLASLERAEDETLSRLYRSTGGVPLAIKWAVGQIKQRGQTLDKVIVALQKGEADFFKNIFERSWKLLSCNARRVLLVMPLFATTATWESIRVVSGVNNLEWLGALPLKSIRASQNASHAFDSAMEQLIEMSLLDATETLFEGRYNLHPLTKGYVISKHQLEPMSRPVRAAFKRMLAYYTRLVALSSPELRMGIPYWDGVMDYDAAQRLEPEWSNLSHLIRRALHAGYDKAALDLFLAVVHRLNAWGLWDERLELAHEICGAARRLKDSSEAWLWIDAMGIIYLQRHQLAELTNALATGRPLVQQFKLGDAELLADALTARLHHEQGKDDLAHQEMEAVRNHIDLDEVLAHENRVRQIVSARAIGAAAVLSQLEGDFAGAKQYFEEELKLRNSLGESVAPVLARLGRASLELGDTASAEAFLAQAAPDAGPKDVALINCTLALIAQKKGDRQEAQRLGKLAAEQYKWLGMRKELEECNAFLNSLPNQGSPSQPGLTERSH
jgi:hypothetical protein